MLYKFIVFLLCTLAVQAVTPLPKNGEYKPHFSCPLPYRPVGDRCLFFHATNTAPYRDMRNFCRSIGGELVQIDDANLHATIVEFIKNEGLSPEKFWIGANDIEEESVWRWPDGSLVRMGTPSWGYVTSPSIKQEPGATRDTTEDCGCLIKSLLYFFHDCICEERNSAICEYSKKQANAVPSSMIQQIIAN